MILNNIHKPLDSFGEASISFIFKPGNGTMRKKNYKVKSVLNINVKILIKYWQIKKYTMTKLG